MKTIFPILVFAASLGFVLQLQAQPKVPIVREDAFAPVSRALREDDLKEAARILRSMKADGLKADQFGRWEVLASRVALRQGDTQWLRELNKDAALEDNANELLILSAMRFLLAAEFKQARVMLQNVDEPEKLPEIPRRRYLQLWMRLEQHEGNARAERVWAEKLVNFAAGWDDPTCRTCHDNPKTHPGEVSTLDLSGWWVGERYVKLLQSSNDAARETELAREILKKNPKDAPARLRLAYALRAGGNEAGAETELRSFPWAKFADRKEKKPLRFGVFP